MKPRIAFLFCCVTAWSCVMSYPAIAISISKLASLSDAQRRELDDIAMGRAPQIKPARPAIHIEIDDIPNAAQAALVSMSFSFRSARR
jgi:hypothetical protein